MHPERNEEKETKQQQRNNNETTVINEKEMKESEKTNMQLKQSLIRLILLAAGVIMVLFGVLRGEAGIVLAKAIRLCLECVGIDRKSVV